MSILRELDDMVIFDEKKEMLERKLRNWTELSAYFSECSEKETLYMLKLEMETKQRHHIIQRLWGKFNRMRSVREYKELMEHYNGP